MAIKQDASGKWRVQVDRAGIPRVRKSFLSQQDAERFEREYLLANNKLVGAVAVTDQRTLLDLVTVWYRYHGAYLSDGVARLAILEQMASDLGNIKAIELTPQQFLEYRFNCTNREKDSITAKTINNRHGYLAAVYRRLRKLKIINYECPIAETDMIKVHERQLGYLSTNQINKLFPCLKASKNESVWWIAQICIRTGARWGEVEKLTRKQLHNNKVTFEFTKSKKVRSVPLDPVFYAGLLRFANYKNPEDRIFCDARKQFGRIVKISDINLPRGQSTHVLRHSFASYFIMNGGNILTLQKILGHSDIKMTMRYAHLAPDHLLDAVKFNPLVSL